MFEEKVTRKEFEEYKGEINLTLRADHELNRRAFNLISDLCPHKIVILKEGLTVPEGKISVSYKCRLCNRELEKVPKGSKVERTKVVLTKK